MTSNVRMDFDGNLKTSWHCAYCDEEVIHVHKQKPPSPSYQDLVRVLKMVRQDDIDTHACITKGTLDAVRDALLCVDTGR